MRLEEIRLGGTYLVRYVQQLVTHRRQNVVLDASPFCVHLLVLHKRKDEIYSYCFKDQDLFEGLTIINNRAFVCYLPEKQLSIDQMLSHTHIKVRRLGRRLFNQQQRKAAV